MKQLFLLLIVTLSLLSCGRDGSSKNSDRSSKISSVEAQLLMGSQWCTIFKSFSENESEFMAEWRLNFFDNGEYSLIFKNLDTYSVVNFEKGDWSINGSRLRLRSAGEEIEQEFSVTQSEFVLDSEYENEDGVIILSSVDFTPCI